MTITTGVDFAASAEKTALVEVVWDGSHVEVTRAEYGVDDAEVIRAIRPSTVTAVDVPFGWPSAFSDLVSQHAVHQYPAPPSSARSWRKLVTMRETDLHIELAYGITPLSVAADRIGHAAIRWAALAASLAEAEVNVLRDGTGPVIEAYPAAALRSWGLNHKNYKYPLRAPERDRLLTALLAQAPSIQLSHHRAAIVRNDDVFDAFVCALVARASSLGRVALPPAGSRAASEGWICVPTVPVADLAGT